MPPNKSLKQHPPEFTMNQTTSQVGYSGEQYKLPPQFRGTAQPIFWEAWHEWWITLHLALLSNDFHAAISGAILPWISFSDSGRSQIESLNCQAYFGQDWKRLPPQCGVIFQGQVLDGTTPPVINTSTHCVKVLLRNCVCVLRRICFCIFTIKTSVLLLWVWQAWRLEFFLFHSSIPSPWSFRFFQLRYSQLLQMLLPLRLRLLIILFLPIQPMLSL